MNYLEKYIGFVMLLFFLSMICERIADFLKNYLSEVNDGLGFRMKTFFKIGDLLTKGPLNGIQEDKRYYRILKINLFCGFVTAWSLHADIFTIISKIDKPFEAIGWNNVIWMWDAGWTWKGSMSYEWIIFLVGCFATGCFISFGSKFWHDMLDILMQIKNNRRLMADPETYKTDNIRSFDQLTNTYESEIIFAAYIRAKQQWMSVPELEGTALKYDESGYYFEVILKADTPAIQPEFEYIPDNGIIKRIRITKIIATDEIRTHAVNLSEEISNSKSLSDTGTLGCIVKAKAANEYSVLTCYHNVVEPGSGFKFSSDEETNNVIIGKGAEAITAVTSFALRDHEIDAALIRLGKEQLRSINNEISGLGQIAGIRDDLKKSDLEKKIPVFLNGAESNFQKGILNGIYCDVTIKYSDGKHKLINLLSFSNNGKAISQPGDSGACVIDAHNKLLGIIVAGNSSTSYAIPATTIFSRLSLELFTS